MGVQKERAQRGMMFHLLYFFVLAIILSAIIGLPQLIAARWPRSCNVVAFLATCVSSYSLSFVVDMILFAIHDEIPVQNIIFPAITWSGISIASGISGFVCARSAAVFGLPFLINGGIAACMTSHSQNLIVAIVLFSVGIVAFVARYYAPTRN